MQPPQPYSFEYDNTDEFGTRLTRQETGDEFNGKVGSYSYTDAASVHRTVNYIADAAGFHATIDTNEPGTKTSEPADAATVSAAVEGPHPVDVKVARPAPVVVRALHPAPVALQAVHACLPCDTASCPRWSCSLCPASSSCCLRSECCSCVLLCGSCSTHLHARKTC
ncbi:unnamed protein product, partial [Ixodes persulcatus]